MQIRSDSNIFKSIIDKYSNENHNELYNFALILLFFLRILHVSVENACIYDLFLGIH